MYNEIVLFLGGMDRIGISEFRRKITSGRPEVVTILYNILIGKPENDHVEAGKGCIIT